MDALRAALAADDRPWHELRTDQGTVSVFLPRLAFFEDGDLVREVEVDGEPAGIGWLPDGRLLVAERLSRRVLRMETDGALVDHAGRTLFVLTAPDSTAEERAKARGGKLETATLRASASDP